MFALAMSVLLAAISPMDGDADCLDVQEIVFSDHEDVAFGDPDSLDVLDEVALNEDLFDESFMDDDELIFDED
ncbi:MAG: hypothetical protein COT85_01945 [Chlamydiae bacterium CG10_big_fil_rev_8_21_14_0_10_42_34]|nr:MAG: hypothetical protein COT85_01945 [Chlamydiae bacterium CG10_big_fil_rev_8_21_14_0_10_42_34]